MTFDMAGSRSSEGGVSIIVLGTLWHLNAMAERSLRQSGGAAPKAQVKYRGVQGHAPSEKIQNPDVNLCDFEHSKKQKVLF